jgi:hypothetical protein
MSLRRSAFQVFSNQVGNRTRQIHRFRRKRSITKTHVQIDNKMPMIAIYQHVVLFSGDTYDTWPGLAIMRIYVSPPEANSSFTSPEETKNPWYPRVRFHPLTMHSYSFDCLLILVSQLLKRPRYVQIPSPPASIRERGAAIGRVRDSALKQQDPC